MPKTVIGQDIIAKQQEATPTGVVGIAKLSNGKWGILKVKVHGYEVLDRDVTKECDDFSEAIAYIKQALGELVYEKHKESVKV